MGVKLVVKLIQPSFEIPRLEELVSDEYDKPVFTATSHGLQAANQGTLLELLLKSGVEIPDGPIFIAGGGDGLELALAPHTFFEIGQIGRRTIISVDKDPKKVKKSRQVAEYVRVKYHTITGKSITYIVQDPQDIVTINTRNMFVDGNISPLPQSAIVWSASVIHWLKTTREKSQAFENFYSILKDKGVLCISMSAGGTASDFLAAYFNVFQRLGAYDKIANPEGYRSGEFEQDPIGSRPLHEIVNMIERAGFTAVLPVCPGESVIYQDPRHYADAVEIYGRAEFLKSLPTSAGEKTKRRVWGMVVEEFLEILRKKGWKEGMPWEYTQYNNYIIATKRKVPQLKGSYKVFDLASGLNERFLRLGYKRYVDRGIDIELSGDEQEIAQMRTEVSLQDIFSALFEYAASDWIDKDPKPTVRIRYGILDKETLVLGVDVKTKTERTIPEIFRQKVLVGLQENKVRFDYKSLEGGIRHYEFKIPLA